MLLIIRQKIQQQEPTLVNAIEQGLRAEHGVVTEDDILMELTKWVEASR